MCLCERERERERVRVRERQCCVLKGIFLLCVDLNSVPPQFTKDYIYRSSIPHPLIFILPSFLPPSFFSLISVLLYFYYLFYIHFIIIIIFNFMVYRRLARYVQLVFIVRI